MTRVGAALFLILAAARLARAADDYTSCCPR